MPLTWKPVEKAQLNWTADGSLPSSDLFRDVYFSRSGAIEESHCVFIEANRLPGRFSEPRTTVVGELGFGFGINFLSTLKTFRKNRNADARLIFISTEKHPVDKESLSRIYESFSEIRDEGRELIANYPHLFSGFHSIIFDEGRVELWLLIGDASDSLSELEARVDAWYLDGFSPKENPDLWGDRVLGQIARLSRSGETTIGSYSVAGEVRRTLERVGFSVEKKKGFAQKRERLEGVFQALPPEIASTLSRASRFEIGFRPERRLASRDGHSVAVVGAGIAGIGCARSLVRAGFSVTCIDSASRPAQGCSSGPQFLYKPHVTGGPTAISFATLRAFGFLLRELKRPGQGLLKFYPEADGYEKVAALVRENILPASLIEEAPEKNAFWFHHAGSLNAARWINETMQALGERLHFIGSERVSSLLRDENLGMWSLLSSDGRTIAQANSIVLAAGIQMPEIIRQGDSHLEFQKVRGQLETLKLKRDQDRARLPQHMIQGESHFTPFDENGISTIGSTYDRVDHSLAPRPADTKRLLAVANSLTGIEFDSDHSWVGLRSTLPDRMPLIGPFSLEHDGLYTVSALASRGMTLSAWAGHLISHFISSAALPVERTLIEEVHPLRFKYRYERKNQI